MCFILTFPDFFVSSETDVGLVQFSLSGPMDRAENEEVCELIGFLK